MVQSEHGIVYCCKKDVSTVCIPDTKGGKEWSGGQDRESLGLTTVARWQGYTQRGDDQNGGIAGAGQRDREDE